MILRLLFLFFAGLLMASAADPVSPWAQPRSLGQFEGLLRRSPFSVPTAEESSPLAERFSLTGAMALDGEDLVFVLDRTTLARERVSRETSPLGLQLIEFLPHADPRKMRATIRLGNQTATIAYYEPPAPSAEPAKEPAVKSAPTGVSVQVPAKAAASNRRIILRQKISGNPAPIR